MNKPHPAGQLTLKKGREKPVLQRHPWIFSGAIAALAGDPAPGDLVDVLAAGGRRLGTAFYNPQSQIVGRLLTWDEEIPIDEAFWRRRLERAYEGRRRLALEPATDAYRLVYSEADGLPGLIVDHYAGFLVTQFLTAGMAARRDLIVELLAGMPLLNGARPAGIVERSDASVRQKEGLPETSGRLWGADPPSPIEIREHGLIFQVDLVAGHKTGFYLDQRENRAHFSRPALVAGGDVLNAFAYTGGFAVAAARGGAGPITNLDTSFPALELAEMNVQRNFDSRPADDYLAGNAFEIMRDFRDQGRQFDAIVLDPPKFVQSQRDLTRATRGYKDINWLALRLLRPGGILVTFSCSGLVSVDLFQKILFGAAVDAGREVQIMQALGQAADHPVLLTFPESAYLKGFLCRVW